MNQYGSLRRFPQHHSTTQACAGPWKGGHRRLAAAELQSDLRLVQPPAGPGDSQGAEGAEPWGGPKNRVSNYWDPPIIHGHAGTE